MDMMDMMNRMMGADAAANCSRFMETMGNSDGFSSGYAPEELRALFRDWLSQIEEEARTSLKGGDVTAAGIAESLGISAESAVYILQRIREKDGTREKGASDGTHA